ncbi:hypothetical protein SEA_ROBINROSE_69 [Microbacterium phage RobinRose]|nr:hypothetical protein SEA_ROBINROSE_69 [Microbacterium phage RobinRose]
MSVADEAKAAAEVEYPARIHIEGMAVPDPRPPFAHGYQRGHEAGVLRAVSILSEKKGWAMGDALKYLGLGEGQ